jgi:predicted signal transduction protein with EAL and GGDEF domain
LNPTQGEVSAVLRQLRFEWFLCQLAIVRWAVEDLGRLPTSRFEAAAEPAGLVEEGFVELVCEDVGWQAMRTYDDGPKSQLRVGVAGSEPLEESLAACLPL